MRSYYQVFISTPMTNLLLKSGDILTFQLKFKKVIENTLFLKNVSDIYGMSRSAFKKTMSFPIEKYLIYNAAE